MNTYIFSLEISPIGIGKIKKKNLEFYNKDLAEANKYLRVHMQMNVEFNSYWITAITENGTPIDVQKAESEGLIQKKFSWLTDF